MTYIAQTNSITFGNIVLDSMPTILGASNQVLAMNAADNAIVWASGGTASGIGTVTSVSSSDNSLTITNGSTAVNAIVNAAHTTNYTVPLNAISYELSGSTALSAGSTGILILGNDSITKNIISGSSGICSLGSTTNPFLSIYVDNINGVPIGSVTSITSSDSSLTITNGSTAANAIVNAAHTTNYTVPLNTSASYQIATNKVLALGGNGADSSSINVGLSAGRTSGSVTGIRNTFVGYVVGGPASLTSATTNSGLGYNSLSALTTGSDNVGINGALSLLTTGSDNIGIGLQAGQDNVSGSSTVNIGTYAGYFNTTGQVVNVGYQAGYKNTTGTGNSTYGYNCLYSNTTDTNQAMSNITALGSNITASTGTAWDNSIAIGHGTNITKSNQCTIGNASLLEIVSGSSGLCNLGSTTDGFNNVYCNNVIGDPGYITNFNLIDNTVQFSYANDQTITTKFDLSGAASGSNLTIINSQLGNGNIAIPNVVSDNFMTTASNQNVSGIKTFNQSLNTTQYYEINGNRILSFGGTGGLDTTSHYIGPLAGNQTSTPNAASNNFIVGSNAGTAISTATNNILIGQFAGNSIQTNGQNIAIGQATLQNLGMTASGCVAIGNVCASNTIGSSSLTAIGAGAARYNCGNNCTCIGTGAGSTGLSQNCVCVGFNSGFNTLGGQSVAIGVNCFTTATGNTTTGVGYSCSVASNGLTNSSCFGANSQIVASNEVVLGSSTVTNIRCGNTGLACSLGNNGYGFGGIYGQNYYVNNGSGVRTQLYSAQTGVTGYTLAIPSLTQNDTLATLHSSNSFTGSNSFNTNITSFNSGMNQSFASMPIGGSYTVTNTDNNIFCFNTGTITLPTPTGSGRVLKVYGNQLVYASSTIYSVQTNSSISLNVILIQTPTIINNCTLLDGPSNQWYVVSSGANVY